MKKLLFIYTIAIIFFSSCTTYLIYKTDTISQVGKTEMPNSYRNKNLQVDYNFWDNGGSMTFTITNLSDKPIYIDWFKSSLIRNGNTLRYYKNKEEKNFEYNSNGAILSNKSGDRSFTYNNLSGNETTYKEERISFIPPYSRVTKSTYSFVLLGNYLNKGDEVEYNILNSPIVFRNYITYSFNEDMKNEESIAHQFYVSNIKCISKSKVASSYSPLSFFIKNEVPPSIDGY